MRRTALFAGSHVDARSMDDGVAGHIRGSLRAKRNGEDNWEKKAFPDPIVR